MFAWRGKSFSGSKLWAEFWTRCIRSKDNEFSGRFSKNTRCSLNGYFLSEFLIKAECATFNYNLGKAFLRDSKLTQSCGFLGQGQTSAVGAQKEFQLFLDCSLRDSFACTLTERWPYPSASQADHSLWRVSSNPYPSPGFLPRLCWLSLPWPWPRLGLVEATAPLLLSMPDSPA